MSAWDKTVLSIVMLALVAVIVSSKQTSAAIVAVGEAVAKLSQNIVGGVNSGAKQ